MQMGDGRSCRCDLGMLGSVPMVQKISTKSMKLRNDPQKLAILSESESVRGISPVGKFEEMELMTIVRCHSAASK